MSEVKSMYKVVYRPNHGSSAEDNVLTKWFSTYEEATSFGSKLADRLLEITQHDMPKNYPDAELDLF